MMFPPAVAFDFNTTTFGGSSSFVSRVSTKQFKRHGLLFNHIFDVSFFRFFLSLLGFLLQGEARMLRVAQ